MIDDATLVTWNSFDNGYYYDSGPLTLTIKTVNITSVSGRVNQAISFISTSSLPVSFSQSSLPAII